MGKRLSKIYTKTGDDGTTGLGDGSRVSKSSLRIEVLGEIDELNAFIGLVRAHLDKQGHHTIAIDVFLEVIQHDLFNIGGSLCFPEHATLLISDARIVLIEDQLDHLNHVLDPLENFVLPGGSEISATIHVARTVCRRAERALVALADQTPVDPLIIKFINRLSDYLFVLARYMNKQLGQGDIIWKQPLKNQVDSKDS